MLSLQPIPHFPLPADLQQQLAQQQQPKSVQPVPEAAYQPAYEHEVRFFIFFPAPQIR